MALIILFLDRLAGARRLAAAKALKHKRINAIIEEGDSDDARLWEIAENLKRLELTPEEKDKHVSEYVKLVAKRAKKRRTASAGEADKPRTEFAVSDKGGRGNKGAASQAAEDLNMSTRGVQKALARNKAREEGKPVPGTKAAKEAAAAAKPSNEVEAAGFVHTSSRDTKGHRPKGAASAGEADKPGQAVPVSNVGGRGHKGAASAEGLQSRQALPIEASAKSPLPRTQFPPVRRTRTENPLTVRGFSVLVGNWELSSQFIGRGSR